MTKDTFMGKSIYQTPRRQSVPVGARVYPIKPGVARLEFAQFREVMSLLKVMVAIPDDLYSSCYERLMVHYAEFVQLMPERIDMPSQSMLGNSLKRSYVITKEFQTLVRVTHGDAFFQTERGARLLFAVFSSSLLFRVAKVIADKQIVLCDKDGKFVQNWAYFSKPLKHYGRYFKFRTIQHLSDTIVSNMTIVLARQLMPELAMAWLAEDREVLEAWFRALNIMDTFFGLQQMTLDVEALMRSSALDMAHQEDHFIAENSKHGEAFWEWLIDHVNSSESGVSLTQDGIGLVDGELLFDVDGMIERFAAERKISQSMVLEQFKHIGIAQVLGHDFAIRHVHNKSNAQSGVTASGLYAQQARQVDKLDAKRFVGVDATIASAYFKGYNGLRDDAELRVDRSGQGILQRLASVFLGNLADGIELTNSGGGL